MSTKSLLRIVLLLLVITSCRGPLSNEIQGDIQIIPKPQGIFWGIQTLRQLLPNEILREASEVFAAYPELSCNRDTLHIHPFFKGPGIHEEIFCAGREETFVFLENVLSEVAELFPSSYLHIGGDEAPKAMWKACPDCRRISGLILIGRNQRWIVRSFPVCWPWLLLFYNNL